MMNAIGRAAGVGTLLVGLLCAIARTVASAPVATGGGGVDPGNDILTIVRGRDEPVTVEAVDLLKGSTRGDVAVRVRNNGPRVVTFISYVLERVDCPKVSKVVGHGFVVGGREHVTRANRYLVRSAPPLSAGSTVTFMVPRKIYLKYARLAKDSSCPVGSHPELVLLRVAFEDGSGWEGYADGPGHGEWWGRPWTPQKYP